MRSATRAAKWPAMPTPPAVPGWPPGTVTSGPVPRGLGIVGHLAALVADLIVPPMSGRVRLPPISSGSGPPGTP